MVCLLLSILSSHIEIGCKKREKSSNFLAASFEVLTTRFLFDFDY